MLSFNYRILSMRVYTRNLVQNWCRVPNDLENEVMINSISLSLRKDLIFEENCVETKVINHLMIVMVLDLCLQEIFKISSVIINNTDEVREVIQGNDINRTTYIQVYKVLRFRINVGIRKKKWQSGLFNKMTRIAKNFY